MARVILMTLLLLGGIVNVQAGGYPYSNMRKGNNGFASDAASFDAATAFFDKTYGRDNDTTAAHRRCMLSRGWKLQKMTRQPISPLGIDPITQSGIDASNQQ